MRPQSGFVPHLSKLGSGKDQALALHCTMAHSGSLRGIAAALEGSVTLIAPDMPSHGRSPDWDGKRSFADTVFQVALDLLDPSRPMPVIGHSFGAATALRLAIEYPDRVRSVALFEPVFFHVAQLDDPSAGEAHKDEMLPIIDALLAKDPFTAARLFNRMWSAAGSPRWPDLPEQVQAAMARAVQVVPDTMDFLIHDSAQMTTRLGDVSVPVLLMRGAQSLDVIAATNSGLRARLPNSVEHVFEGAGHMGPITHPADVAQVWWQFVQRGISGN